MRKPLLLLAFLIIPLAILGILILNNKSTTPEKSLAEEKETLTPNTNSIQIENLTFSWFEVENTESLKLIPNYTQKISSQDILSQYKCKFLTSAGFYSKSDTPLGLTIADGITLSSWQESSLFDGLLSVNYLLTPRITRIVPEDNLKVAVQSGPIIKENGKFEFLRIQNDSEARRLVAAITGENKLFFIVVYNSTSFYSGPLLADLPSKLQNFEEKTGIVFADILNLDGGSASLFHTPTVNLSEFNSVGAFFCQP